MTYFWTPSPIGVNADIDRHRQELDKLDGLILEIERRPETTSNNAAITTIRHLRSKLLVSMVEVTDKIGRKKT